MILAAIAGLAGKARTPYEMMPKWSPQLADEETPDVTLAALKEAFGE